MSDTEYHLIIYSPDGIAIAHHYDDEVINKLANIIKDVTTVASKQGFISHEEILEASEKFIANMRDKA